VERDERIFNENVAELIQREVERRVASRTLKLKQQVSAKEKEVSTLSEQLAGVRRAHNEEKQAHENTEKNLKRTRQDLERERATTRALQDAAVAAEQD
jgi:hypothetical protein